MSFVAIFFAGAFLCNAMPHLTAGLRGEMFPSPFSKPHGKGPSSPLVNFLWGMLNVSIGLALLVHYPFEPGVNVDSAAMLVGVLVMGVFSSVHFGRVRREGLF
ncbi:LapA family protein [Caballeronia sordidicola]|uniref:LapA family protein n=1 Tax=Caballeronia sordidicola TaxID=196367 RepID=UPI0004D02332|nr:LapA family protein [Caballeronia sordidicola]